jgi:hypothetical protein
MIIIIEIVWGIKLKKKWVIKESIEVKDGEKSKKYISDLNSIWLIFLNDVLINKVDIKVIKHHIIS